MTLEYTVTAGEATIVVQAESEQGLGRVEILAPSGQPVLRLGADSGQDLSVSGFVVETRESDAETLLDTYAEGTYQLRAWTVDGQPVDGQAQLSHELLPAPLVVHPLEGALVPAAGLVVRWVEDPEAVAYQVVLEQGDDDTLTVTLPSGSNSFEVPGGVLAPGQVSHLEVGAIGRNRNCTRVEVEFTTL